MSYRAGIILIQEGKVALIERSRDGRHYFAFPGGHIDARETPEQAAVRETLEELGLQVRITRLVAKFLWQGWWQFYFLAESLAGEFGSGKGEEMLHPAKEKGTYRPVWMPLAEIPSQPVMPPALASLVVRSAVNGWPEQPVVIAEAKE
jgi:8-oxo-dGTP diphosphatase